MQLFCVEPEAVADGEIVEVNKVGVVEVRSVTPGVGVVVAVEPIGIEPGDVDNIDVV